jgi:hypothetical protein
MTYPQQYAPQGYAPAPQQPAGQPIAPPMPTLRDGGSSGGAAAPKMRHLVGRTIIVEPIAIGEARNPETNQVVPEARFNLTVCDGGPLQYGDNQSRDVAKQRPNTHEIGTPCRFTGVTDIGYGFVQSVREALETGEPGRLGVVQQGTKGNKPFLITKTSTDVEGRERPDGQQRFENAMAIFGKIWADKHAPAGAPRQFVSPEPRSLVAPPPAHAAAPQVNYTTPAQAPQQYAAYAPTSQTYGYQGAPAGYPMQPAEAAAYVAQIPGQPPAPPAYGGIPAPQSAPPAAALPAMAPLPPGVEAWLATLPPEQATQQRAAFLAQQGPQQQAYAAPAGPGM